MRPLPANPPARRTNPDPAPAWTPRQRTIVVLGLLIASAMLAFYVDLLHEQVTRGEQFRARQVASGQPVQQSTEDALARATRP